MLCLVVEVELRSVMSEGKVCDWRKFRDLSPILTARGAYLKLKGKICSACVKSSML